jgi:ubiquinone/menaquinone biosynthesis C-methylase UbiE
VGAKIEMDDFKLNPAVLRDGIYILTEINNEFESIYLNVRAKENRIYLDNELINLPFPSKNNLHKKEWNLRAKSYNRFKEYLRQKKDNLNILDLGCGNGWFCGQLSNSFNHNFYCVDVNLTELTQGRRVFNSGQMKFIYADIFASEIPDTFFDIVIINAAVQYFPDLIKLVEQILVLLKNNGEIHIIDSPFYSESEVDNARKRTVEYYRTMGLPEMANNYFHRSWDELSEYNFEILYQPATLTSKFRKLFFIKGSPFPWIKIIR